MKRLVIGTTGFPFCRHFIADTECNFWNDRDNEWTGDLRRATLYAEGRAAAEKIHELMLAQMDGELTIFVTRLQIEVKGDPVTAEELGKWLSQNVRVIFDVSHGTGPVEISMTVLRVDWEDLK